MEFYREITQLLTKLDMARETLNKMNALIYWGKKNLQMT